MAEVLFLVQPRAGMTAGQFKIALLLQVFFNTLHTLFLKLTTTIAAGARPPGGPWLVRARQHPSTVEPTGLRP